MNSVLLPVCNQMFIIKGRGGVKGDTTLALTQASGKMIGLCVFYGELVEMIHLIRQFLIGTWPFICMQLEVKALPLA